MMLLEIFFEAYQENLIFHKYKWQRGSQYLPKTKESYDQLLLPFILVSLQNPTCGLYRVGDHKVTPHMMTPCVVVATLLLSFSKTLTWV